MERVFVLMTNTYSKFLCAGDLTSWILEHYTTVLTLPYCWTPVVSQRASEQAIKTSPISEHDETRRDTELHNRPLYSPRSNPRTRHPTEEGREGLLLQDVKDVCWGYKYRIRIHSRRISHVILFLCRIPRQLQRGIRSFTRSRWWVQKLMSSVTALSLYLLYF